MVQQIVANGISQLPADAAERNAILFDRYWRIIQIHAYKARIPDMLLVEVQNELFIALAEAILKFDLKRGASEKTFVERVLHNKVVDMVRQAKSQKRTGTGLYSGVWA